MRATASADPEASAIERAVLDAVAASRGHFRYESGHHGDLWLDLEGLFVDARRLRGWAALLARRAAETEADFVCGPLVGGAFVAQWMAAESGASFVYAERLADGGAVRYRVPDPLRGLVRGRRVLLVDDAVNAGSALRLTLADVRECGGEPAGFASLVTLGEAGPQIAAQHGVPFFTLATLRRGMWAPRECPLCAIGAPLSVRVAP